MLRGTEHQNRCAACHAEGKFPAIAWLAPAHPVAGELQKQQELCLKCHLQELPALANKSPHDLDLDKLDAITKRIRSRRLESNTHLVGVGLNTASSPIHWRTHELACSDCHREHQGTDHDLTKLTKARCQSCHIEQFQGFEHGHPEFQNYPNIRDSAISFDHLKHRDLHFTKENKNFDCRSCHLQEESQGAVGKVFRSVSFEAACASCHNKSIQSSLSEGIVVFQLPSLDKAKLLKSTQETTRFADSESSLQDWPEAASQMMDGTVPPIMQLLLSSDDEGKTLLASLPASTNVGELDLNRTVDQVAAIQLAQASKRLLKEIADDGQKAILRRVESLLKNLPEHPTHSAWSIQLAEGIPPDVFRGAMRNWFPGNKAANTNPEPTGWNPKPLKPIQHLSAGGWMLDERRMAIVYIPKGHADPWLTAWTTLAAQASHRFKESETEENRSSWISGNEVGMREGPGSGLLNTKSSGRCTECHTAISKIASEGIKGEWLSHSIANNWKSKPRSIAERAATRFNHGPHLLISSIDDCAACHRLNEPTKLTKESIGLALDKISVPTDKGKQATHFISHRTEPEPSLTSEFAPMRKSNCSQCHRQNAAGDSCTQCHNYHLKPVQ